MKVAVYGTLKKGFGNHRLLEGATYLGEDYVEFSTIQGFGYPVAKFKEGTGKYLKVELYLITKNMLPDLDRLEGYKPGSEFNLYNRIKIKTLNGVNCSIYEYNGEVEDKSNMYLENSKGDNLFFNWK